MSHNLPDLRTLTLNDNRVASISGLDGCASLTFLSLHGNQIEKIEGPNPTIDALVGLEYLALSKNRIETIENLERLPSLRDIYIDDNPLKRIARVTYEYLRENNVRFFFSNRKNMKDVETSQTDDGHPYTDIDGFMAVYPMEVV